MTMLPRRLAAALVALAALPVVCATPAVADAATTPFCGAGDVATSYHAQPSGGGYRYGQVVMRNTSGHACRTHGFGGISYVDDLGRQVGASADRVSGFEPHLTLQPGQRAVTELEQLPARSVARSVCHPRRVASFDVIVPDGTVGRFVAHPTLGCANPAVHLLSHTPYRRP